LAACSEAISPELSLRRGREGSSSLPQGDAHAARKQAGRQTEAVMTTTPRRRIYRTQLQIRR